RTSEITRTEQRIAEIDALQQTIDQLQQDLQLYGQTLRRELDLLQQEVAAPPAEDEAEAVSDTSEEEPQEGVEELPPDTAPDDIAPSETANLQDADFTDLDSDIGIGQMATKQRSPFELEEMEGGPEKVGGKPVSVLISDGTVSEDPLNGWVLD